ncbi:phenylalanine--tRNA ligase subunit alpha [Planctomycetota bacterium]
MDPDVATRTRDEALTDIENAHTPADLEAVRIRYLGRKGLISQYLTEMGSLSAEDRPRVGKLLNQAKAEITRALATKSAGSASDRPSGPPLDVTLPGKKPVRGAAHPITRTMDEISEIFASLGFTVATGPEVEREYYNFEALNMPMDHPSRDAFDTLFLKNGGLMRSHTSTVQIRYMKKHTPPIRIIAPGRVYRPDTVDASHHFMFHQIEGLAVDENITFADLKAVLMHFAHRYFGQEVKMRFRPSFFPFTEPSAEVDISCFICGAKGCAVCSGSGWLEVLGCGMVDVNVFKAVEYDEEKYTGFAFGMGVERMAMLKHGINDIRLFTENDVRFLGQLR